MSDYKIVNGNLHAVDNSSNELKHWKYVTKKRGKNGKWVYEYEDRHHSRDKRYSGTSGKVEGRDLETSDRPNSRDKRYSGTSGKVEGRKKETTSNRPFSRKKRYQKSTNAGQLVKKGSKWINKFFK